MWCYEGFWSHPLLVMILTFKLKIQHRGGKWPFLGLHSPGRGSSKINKLVTEIFPNGLSPTPLEVYEKRPKSMWPKKYMSKKDSHWFQSYGRGVRIVHNITYIPPPPKKRGKKVRVVNKWYKRRNWNFLISYELGPAHHPYSEWKSSSKKLCLGLPFHNSPPFQKHKNSPLLFWSLEQFPFFFWTL